MELCNVTNLYKNKGEHFLYNSYRGIFRTPVLRNILDKLMYNEEYPEIDSNLSDSNVGGRRNRNVRDNIFVMNAVMNEGKKNPKEPLDINVYDAFKCFDSLWLSECINDLYDSGLRNDKLALIYASNRNANIAIKTSNGTTERFIIKDKVMQGTVWSGLMCTNTMDKLCKHVYKNQSLQYQYRGKVGVPPQEMVDDIVTVSKCGATSVAINACVNSFIEQKKLKLNPEKCAKIHVGRKSSESNCPKNLVHKEQMKHSDKEKYLGDYLTKEANSKETIKSRIIRGHAVLSQMTAFLNDIPLGKYRTEVGLTLRHAWFLNGCLFNSEVWSGYHKSDIDELEKIDRQILRLIIGAQAKVPTEMLYLETSEIPVKYVRSVRRLVYLNTFLKRHDAKITKKVYVAMKENPLKYD